MPVAPGPAQELDELFYLAQVKLNIILTAVSDLEGVLGKIRERTEKTERLSQLLKEPQG